MFCLNGLSCVVHVQKMISMQRRVSCTRRLQGRAASLVPVWQLNSSVCQQVLLPASCCPTPCPCCAEGLKWGLDFEQALSDPDMVDLVTSPQVSNSRAIQTASSLKQLAV